jgi:hypothetical protein
MKNFPQWPTEMTETYGSQWRGLLLDHSDFLRMSTLAAAFVLMPFCPVRRVMAGSPFKSLSGVSVPVIPAKAIPGYAYLFDLLEGCRFVAVAST